MARILNTCYLFFLFWGLFYSCKPDKIKTQISKINSLNIQSCDVYNPIDSCIKDIKILPLYTDSTCLIGYINKLEIHDHYIFILDYNQNVFIYGTNGSFISKIAATGRGPQDITRLKEFYINPYQKYIGIFDDIKQKIFRFNYKGELLKIISCKDPVFSSASEMKLISPDELLLTLNYSPGITSSYAIINPENYSMTSKLLNYSYQWQRPSKDANYPKQFGNKTGYYVVNMLSDTLYKYSDQQLVPCLTFKSPKPAFKKMNPKTVKDYSDIVAYAYNHDLSHGISKIIMTDDIGYTEYYYNGHINHVFWYLDTLKAVYSPKFGDNPNLLKDFNVCSATGKYFIGFILPSQINQEIIRSECSHEVAEMILSMKEDDNPALVFYPIHF